LDFGTGFDCFDPLAHTANPEVGTTQKRNRLMLKSMMEKNGFKNLAEEWWHFTLKNEPFPDKYFNFVVK
jgi:D-alanyl-D-alanine dipeptidase